MRQLQSLRSIPERDSVPEMLMHSPVITVVHSVLVGTALVLQDFVSCLDAHETKSPSTSQRRHTRGSHPVSGIIGSGL